MGQWDRNGNGGQHLEQALAAVEAMGASDVVVVPATPSASMLAAGARTGRCTPETAARIYRAMVLAGDC